MLLKLSERPLLMLFHLSDHFFIILQTVSRGELAPRRTGRNEKTPEGGSANKSKAGGIGTIVTAQLKLK